MMSPYNYRMALYARVAPETLQCETMYFHPVLMRGP